MIGAASIQPSASASHSKLNEHTDTSDKADDEDDIETFRVGEDDNDNKMSDIVLPIFVEPVDQEEIEILDLETNVESIFERDENVVENDGEAVEAYFLKDYLESAAEDVQSGAEETEETGSTECSESKTDVSVKGSGKLFKCKACGNGFPNKHKLRVHCREEGPCKFKQDRKVAICKDCGAVCKNKGQLRVHRSKGGACKSMQGSGSMYTSNDNNGVCSVCERVFARKLSLVKHMREHRFTDKILANIVTWIKEDPTAAQEVEDATGFQCTECERSFSTIEAICWHLRIHADRTQWQLNRSSEVQVGEFQCTVCDRRFHNDAEYYCHCAENAEAHECLECGRRIEGSLRLRLHRLIHRKMEMPTRLAMGTRKRRTSSASKAARLHPCPVCSQVFKHAIHLDSHMTKHTGVKNFICHICAKPFATKGQLKRHILIHEPKQFFDCAQCEKRFTLRDTLQRHVRSVHDQSRQHLCNLCGWSFGEKHQLRKHLKTHSNDPEAAPFVAISQK